MVEACRRFLVLAGECLWFSVFFTPAFPPMARASNTLDFAQQAANSPNSQPGRAKIAEGEYVVVEQANLGAIGPFGEEVYDFHETWTIWRTDSGEYEVEGKRQFESPKDSPHENSFQVRLSRDLTVIDMTEFSKLRWRADSGPLSCGFLPDELHCSSNARDSKQEVNLHASM